MANRTICPFDGPKRNDQVFRLRESWMNGDQKENVLNVSAIDADSPVIFLGIADGIGIINIGTPFETITIFNLSCVKAHFSYPAILAQSTWCFLFKSDASIGSKTYRIRLLNIADEEIAHINFSFVVSSSPIAPEQVSEQRPEQVSKAGIDERAETSSQPTPFVSKPQGNSFTLNSGAWIFQSGAIPTLNIAEPGNFTVQLEKDGRKYLLGSVIFVFNPPPPLTEDQIAALDSDPVAMKAAKLMFSCKLCGGAITAYAASRKSPDIESEGAIFYRDLPDVFVCDCKRTNINLTYARTGLHGFLGKTARQAAGDISFIRAYADNQLREVAGNFLKLIEKETKKKNIF